VYGNVIVGKEEYDRLRQMLNESKFSFSITMREETKLEETAHAPPMVATVPIH